MQVSWCKLELEVENHKCILSGGEQANRCACMRVFVRVCVPACMCVHAHTCVFGYRRGRWIGAWLASKVGAGSQAAQVVPDSVILPMRCC